MSARAFAAGVKVGFGNDAAVYPFRNGLNRARSSPVMVQHFGLYAAQAIQLGDNNEPRSAGWSDKIGTIGGQWPDIIAVDADPWPM